MKRLVYLVSIFIAILLLSTAAYADPIDIRNQTEFDALLQEASTSNTYYFNLSGSSEHVITIDNSKIGDRIYVGSSSAQRSLEIDNPLISLNVFGDISDRAFMMRNLTIGTNGGSIYASGGSGASAYGIHSGSVVTQNGGIIYASGGSGTRAYGIYSDGVTQSGGSIYASGGSGAWAYGIHSDSAVTQNGGIIYASGGSGDNAYGIYSGRVTQNGGIIYASGGSGTRAYGIVTMQVISIGSTLTIAREGTAASISMRYDEFYDNHVSLEQNSTLKPIIDLSKLPDFASGHIAAVLVVKDGVTLAPRLVNSYMLEPDDTTSFAAVPFASADYTIDSGFPFEYNMNGSFDFITNTITMTYDATTDNQHEIYYLSIVRELTPQEAFLAENAPENYTNLVENIYDTLTQSSNAASYTFLIKLLDDIDNSVTVEEAIASIDAAVSIPLAMNNWNVVAKRDFNNYLISLDAKLNDLSNNVNKYWIDIPFIIGKINDNPEMVFGAIAGYAGALGEFSYAAQVNGSYGTIENGSILSKKLSFGILAKAEYTFHINNLFNPKAGINIGYSYGVLGDNITSQNAFLIGLNVSNKFKVFDMITIEPVIGINYIPIMFGEFTDGTDTVDKSIDTSLTADVKVNVGYAISESLVVNINGFVNIDLLLASTFEDIINRSGELNAVLYELTGGDSRFTFGGGVNVSYKLPMDMSIDASYLIYVHKKDMSHQIKVGVNMSF